MAKISGHHHISMVTKNANENSHFYRDILGLRRVKITVNQNDPSMYHLFYGDRTGSPGTELSFFEMPAVGKTQRGTNAITKIGLLVPAKASLVYWQKRFAAYNVDHSDITTYANHPALHFEDDEGLRMVLLAAKEAKLPHWQTWEKSVIPADHQIQGLGAIEITVRELDKLADTLTKLFGYTEISRTDDEAIFQSVPGEIFGEIVVKYSAGPTEKPGQGSIHHLAIRVPDEEALNDWLEQVTAYGFHSTGIVDRYYFKSLYFRETNGILFEMATDEPGLTVDTSVDHLGEKFELPPFLEDRRAEIESKLPPIDAE